MTRFFFRCSSVVLSVAFVLSILPSVEAADSPIGDVTVQPASVQLRNPRQPQSFQVLGATADGYTLDLRAQARFTSANPEIATVDEGGWVRPVASGQTQIEVTIGSQKKTVVVTVQLSPGESLYSFRHEVMPVLSKAGCNAGACHGYSLGKNGFKLSLRGSDPELDFNAISKEFFGRRVNIGVPEASLIIAKARGDMAHEGGVRFKKDS